MARIEYLWNTPHYKSFEEDKLWMLNNGCEQVIEVNMYKSGHIIDDIWKQSGFKSLNSLFGILNETGVNLDRGHTKGSIKKMNRQENQES